jgi:hypothetical protein
MLKGGEYTDVVLARSEERELSTVARSEGLCGVYDPSQATLERRTFFGGYILPSSQAFGHMAQH